MQGASPVTLENLRRGIEQLYARHNQQGKPSKGRWDFQNAFYLELDERRRGGLDTRFWDYLVDELSKWKAIRGRAEHTKQGIRDRGLKQLSELQRCFYSLVPEGRKSLPALESVEWADVSPLFELAHQIKNVPNPMFASKLCHFLIPSIYFVIDGTLVKRGWKEWIERLKAASAAPQDRQPSAARAELKSAQACPHRRLCSTAEPRRSFARRTGSSGVRGGDRCASPAGCETSTV
jgi:hypothetical protein